MKQTVCILSLLIFALSLQAQDTKTKIKTKGNAPAMMLPYTAHYSSQFKIGNPAHAEMVLQLWKDYDDNDFGKHAAWFADTMQMISTSGLVTKGKAANMEAIKKYRSSLTSASSTVDAWIPLRSIDKNEDWVAIWGTETDTYADGHTEKSEIHEIWQINKDGKVVFIKQYTGKSPERS